MYDPDDRRDIALAEFVKAHKDADARIRAALALAAATIAAIDWPDRWWPTKGYDQDTMVSSLLVDLMPEARTEDEYWTRAEAELEDVEV